MNTHKTLILFFVISFITVLLIIIDFNIGDQKLPIKSILKFFNIFGNDDEFHNTIKILRFPRILSAVLAGVALSVSGLLMQTIFRNPLADASILGVSSGAGLGVAFVVLGSNFFFNIDVSSNVMQLVAAAIGAALIMAIIMLISIRLKDMLSILIIGIIISGVINAIILILQSFANNINLKTFVLWTMGSLTGASFADIMLLIPIICVSIVCVFCISKNLNLFLPGENFAKTMGVNVQTIKIIVFVLVSILTGAITVFCGPIAFIGIISPHIARWLFNTSNHFLLIPATLLIGICFMLFGDIILNLMITDINFPINAIISILGTPFVLWIVIKNKRTIV